MFNQKDNRLDQSYLETQEHAARTSAEFAKLLWELLKALNEKWKEHQENRKVAVKVDEETYNLVEDPNTPGAYKWEKVDLNKESKEGTKTQIATDVEISEFDSKESNTEPIQYNAEIENSFTKYQAQILATRLVSLLPESNRDYDDYSSINLPPAIQITATKENGETKVLYEQTEDGEVIKNAFTEELSQEEILDAAYEPLSKLLPSESPLLLPPSGNIEAEAQAKAANNIDASASDMLSQIIDESSIENSNNQNTLEIKRNNELINSDNESDEFDVPNNENLTRSPIPQYDADGLILENDVDESKDLSKKQKNGDFDIDEFTEVNQPPKTIKKNENNQLPQQNEDILFIDETQTEIKPNSLPDNDEIDEFYNLEATVKTENSLFNESQPKNINNPDEVVKTSSLDSQESNVDDVEPVFNESELNESSTQQTTESNGATFIAGTTATQVSINSKYTPTPPTNYIDSEHSTLATKKQNTEVIDEATTLTVKKPNDELQEEKTRQTAKKLPTPEQEESEPAANYTYKEIASNPEVEPRTQQWAKQSTIPVYEIKHRGEKAKVEFENNKSIASSATEMLKKYGTIETDGSRIYRSDAFAIRKKDNVVSIHRRGDEAKGFKEALIEFTLDDKNKPIIKKDNLLNNLSRQTTTNRLSPVEKQEFLIVAEQLKEGKGLPDLQSADIREMGNTLGSLAPAGTLRTLKAFKETEVLGILNSTLNQAKRDELNMGDFNIKRERDPENENRVSLVLTKDNNDGRGSQKLVQFDLEKTENGVESKVAAMNISDYDISQIKELAKNSNNQDFSANFYNNNETQNSKLTTEYDNRNVGAIPIEVHPWIKQEWVQMVDELKEEPPHTLEILDGVEEIKEKLSQNKGKASIPDQCEMYDKIVTHKVAMAQQVDDPNGTVALINKSEIINDLKGLRLEAINQNFTPVENLTEKQKAVQQQAHTAPRPTQRPKQPQGVEL
ncbi:hypothetical protein CAL7716_102140 (plasmid) [Calothrix sp. PCC 7716]|nr:hypothetical protein CAL7716_102140 [Calothrix sp. PCC 7716]